MLTTNDRLQVISDGEKMGIITPSWGVMTVQKPVVRNLTVNQEFDRFESMHGDRFAMPRCVTIDISIYALGYDLNPDQNDLIDFGLVDQMSVRQLFDAINKKLSKR